jgi:hypothetical protein
MCIYVHIYTRVLTTSTATDKQLGNVMFVLECYCLWFITEKWGVLNYGK